MIIVLMVIHALIWIDKWLSGYIFVCVHVYACVRMHMYEYVHAFVFVCAHLSLS